MTNINKLKLAVSAVVFLAGTVSSAAMSRPTSEGSRGYVNNYNRVDFVNKTFVNKAGLTEPLESMHVVIKDLDKPSDDIVTSCNVPFNEAWTSENKLKYSKQYEHAFRAFVYVNTEYELEENLVAVFMVSPGRFGVHVETSGKRTLGSYTSEGDFNVLDHDPSILAGGKFGQFEDKSVFDLYTSKASEGAKMYEAIFFKRGTALHGSDGLVDGNPRSHACVRFRREEAPLNQKLAIAVGGNVKVSVRDTEVFKSCYDKEFIRQVRDEANAFEEWKKNPPAVISPRARKAIENGQGGLY